MPTINIRATDTLFFRDGRPFSMGEESFAQGIFPPPPSVIYGALRSSYLSNGLESGDSYIALVNDSEQLNFSFFSFSRETTPYFPMPKDLILPKSQNTPELLELVAKPAYSSNLTPMTLRAAPGVDDKLKDEPCLITGSSLKHYLEGNKTKLSVSVLNEFITKENKIGIGRDKDRSVADDGKLFRLQSNRLSSKMDSKGHFSTLEFLIGFENLDLPENGWLLVGGERRAASYYPGSSVSIPCPKLEKEQFKIYLATPAAFASGWRPEKLLEKYELELLAAAIDRPLSIGGWDLKEKKPKPMVLCVPAGAVYYVKAKSTEAALSVSQAIHGKSISDNLNQTNYRKQGFGIAYVGKI